MAPSACPCLTPARVIRRTRQSQDGDVSGRVWEERCFRLLYRTRGTVATLVLVLGEGARDTPGLHTQRLTRKHEAIRRVQTALASQPSQVYIVASRRPGWRTLPFLSSKHLLLSP
jgi:hypothetical protein